MVDEKSSAICVQSQEAARMMECGDPEPSTIPSLNALRLIKSRTKQSSHLDSDPIISVIKMKGNAPFSLIFRDIGYDPFFLHYWSAAQENAYRIYTRQTPVLRVSIDATGGVVRPIHLVSGRRTRAIFFYEIAVRDSVKEIQFPVAHMLSERHNNLAIAFFLLSWMREDKIKPPKICVTDQSRALMMACVRAFTQYETLDDYLSVCSSLIRGEDFHDVPSCMIRNDFAHIMHIVSGWKEVKEASRRSKDFYLRSIALIIASTCFDDAKKLLKCVFTVLLNELEGHGEDSAASVCEIAKNYLKELIKSPIAERAVLLSRPDGDVESEYYDPSDEELEESEECKGEGKDAGERSIFREIQAIYRDCKTN